MTTKIQCRCRQIKTLVDYVRATNPENLDRLWIPVQGELPENQDPEQFLRDPRNRISNEALRDIMEQTRKATSDDMAVYKAALAGSNGSRLGRALKRRFRVFFGPKHTVQKVQEGSPSLLGNKPEILSISDTHAVVRLRWAKDLPLSSDFCLFAKGEYQAIPSWFGLAPARLWERVCFFKGGPWCEYEIWWDKRPRERRAPRSVLPKGRRLHSAIGPDVKQTPISAIANGAGPKTGVVVPTKGEGQDRKAPLDVSRAVKAHAKKAMPPSKDRSQGKGRVKGAKKPQGKPADFSKTGGVRRQLQQVFATIGGVVSTMLSDVDSGHRHFDALKGIEAMSRRGADLTEGLFLEPARDGKPQPEASTPQGQGRKNRQGLADRLPRGTETVLLVDDDEVFIDVGRQMLEAMGYRVVGAGSGQDAVKKYQKHSEKIHMVILNMVLPDMGGGEVYDKLKAVNSEVKVLLSSGYSVDRAANEVLARGCKGFLQKPFSLEQLSRRMREILDNKRPATHG
jgi:CheY-like chemotaxis protein